MSLQVIVCIFCVSKSHMVNPLLLLFLFKRLECESIWGRQKNNTQSENSSPQETYHGQSNSQNEPPTLRPNSRTHLSGERLPGNRMGTNREGGYHRRNRRGGL